MNEKSNGYNEICTNEISRIFTVCWIFRLTYNLDLNKSSFYNLVCNCKISKAIMCIENSNLLVFKFCHEITSL